MSGQTPTVGRIVHYRLTEQDVSDAFRLNGPPPGAPIRPGDVCAATVVGVFAAWKSVDAPPALDLKVALNQPGQDLWVPGVRELPPDEDGTGQWFWPPRVGG